MKEKLHQYGPTYAGKEIIQQGEKQFVKSDYRDWVYLWINRPMNTKSFDYYMCNCGRIISNCGFSQKHKCKIGSL